jgi:hypothetical protein
VDSVVKVVVLLHKNTTQWQMVLSAFGAMKRIVTERSQIGTWQKRI